MRSDEPVRTTRVPAPTASPMLAALGITLALAGLVTTAAVSIVGGVLFVAGAVGWFREVLPREHEEEVPLEAPAAPVAASPHAVLRLAAGEARHRARLPVTIYPYSAGVAGGVAGGVAMAGLAMLYGVVAHGSPWYPVNLLAAAASSGLSQAPAEALGAMRVDGIVLGILIHGTLSMLVGLLYGVLLPTVPSHPALWGGLVAPLMWTGLVAATLRVVDPALAGRIDWPWFIASQVAFGVVAGFVVARAEQIPTTQHQPLRVRAGIEGQDEP